MPKTLLVICCVTLGIFVAAGAKLMQVWPRGPVVVASLPAARGIRTGASVEYRGVPIGVVEDISFGDSTVLLTLRLSRSDIPLRNTDRIGIHTLGLLGDKNISIVPYSGTGRPWQPGDTLRSVPPDSMVEVREAAVRAVVESALGKLLRPDTTGPSTPAPRISP